MINGTPEFGKSCTSCFACIQWCPKSAIQFGHYNLAALNIRKYHHPSVKASDLSRF